MYQVYLSTLIYYDYVKVTSMVVLATRQDMLYWYRTNCLRFLYQNSKIVQPSKFSTLEVLLFSFTRRWEIRPLEEVLSQLQVSLQQRKVGNTTAQVSRFQVVPYYDIHFEIQANRIRPSPPR